MTDATTTAQTEAVHAQAAARREWAEIIARAPRPIKPRSRSAASVPPPDAARMRPGEPTARLPERPWGSATAQIVLWGCGLLIIVVVALAAPIFTLFGVPLALVAALPAIQRFLVAYSERGLLATNPVAAIESEAAANAEKPVDANS
jgi:Flp pilus assembly protein TadB